MQNRVDVGGVLSRAFSIYGEQASVLLPVAFGLFLVVGIIQGLLAGPLLILAAIVSLIAGTLYSGMVVKLVQDVQDGRRDNSAGELLSSATPFIVPLILAGLVVGILVGIGLILLIVPGLFLLTIFAVVSPVIVVERLGVFEAMGRSRALVRGQGWAVFGVIVVVFLISFVIGGIIGGIGAAIGGTVGRIVLQILANTVTAPIGALVAAVLYFTLSGNTGMGDATAPAAPDPTVAPPPPPPAQ